MRQLLGKSRLPSRNLTEEVYLSEHIYCQNCQITVPMGIEVWPAPGLDDTRLS